MYAAVLNNTMAEVLGAVASGIAVAQLASSVLAIGAKMRTLLEKVHETPEEIHLRLEQLELLSASLQSFDDNVFYVNGKAHGVLQTAKVHCQTCLAEPQDMLADVSSQIQQFRGIRKKFSVCKVVLKKTVFDRIECRISRSLDLLSIAQQAYMMYVLSSTV